MRNLNKPTFKKSTIKNRISQLNIMRQKIIISILKQQIMNYNKVKLL